MANRGKDLFTLIAGMDAEGDIRKFLPVGSEVFRHAPSPIEAELDHLLKVAANRGLGADTRQALISAGERIASRVEGEEQHVCEAPLSELSPVSEVESMRV